MEKFTDKLGMLEYWRTYSNSIRFKDGRNLALEYVDKVR